MDRSIKVADECWIALATLTQRHPEREAFSGKEILDEVRRLALHTELRPGVTPHIHLHNVANLPPNTARYRLFYRLDDGSYRLYRPGDTYHPERSAGKSAPRTEDVPVEYHHLIDWYDSVYCAGKSETPRLLDDPILRLRGLGKDLWKEIDPDAFVNDLRSMWGVDQTANFRIDSEDVWRKLLRNQGSQFKTVTDLPFTYKIEGATGIWFFRDGKRINRRLGRQELESALQKLPLRSPTELKEFQDPSYLFGLLTDRRIIGRE